MGLWRTVVIEGRPKFWDKPNCRWKLNTSEDESLIEVVATQADYDEINTDPDTEELTQTEADVLSQSWGDPPWIYPTSDELYGIGYCSIADLRERSITGDMATDEELRMAIKDATLHVNAYCSRDFWRREETYKVDGTGSRALFFEDRPVISIAVLRIDGTTLAQNEYALYGEAGYISLMELDPNTDRIFPRGAQNIEVQGQFGYEAIPDEVRHACMLICLDVLRDIKVGIDLTGPAAVSVENAIGLKRAKVEDISVEFEYPSSVKSGSRELFSTGNRKADGLLRKFRRDLEAFAV